MGVAWLDRWRSYRFEEEWVVEAPVKTVWDGMLHVEAWPGWWQGLESSESSDALPPGMAGKQYTTRWKGALPYGLDIRAVLREVTDQAYISADIHGDIEGHCSCCIEKSRRGTRGQFSLQVRTARPWMSLLSPFLKSYFTENHKRLMAEGMRGFSRYVSEGVVP
ncbi:SRPBCC family protein [Desulfoluna spongiiphila]|uniref:Polyketide cyclase / dehydrase and lipid transport n=1 Tax=Desulfoluna spongiiphila TaxID=419481 RepID=A0A1G5E9N2_9BACT|nr:SRPBCC family protein [Desulfoluna spongiiphila]SCY23605.1 Polyketide cyclase / dehydrase and lipid transport [Desulfoluna spongiiphila]VVS91667.1 polyketide cyclase/dehydrase [Desulfoluna spongiiphila]